MDQNPTLDLDGETAASQIIPLSTKVPKSGDKVWWICSVGPEVFKKIVGRRIYLGMNCCRVVEHEFLVKCPTCQRFGHGAAACKVGKTVCGYCAGAGHKAAECKATKPRCANCGLAFTAGHRNCVARVKARISAARRTDFGP